MIPASQKFYAHTLEGKTQEHWEPLFTAFGESSEECEKEQCSKCANMEPAHGHLNKVAFIP